MNGDKLKLAVSGASGVPFYRQIVDQLAALIRSGALPAGEKLPSVRELTGDLLVSLITVRRAYSDLEHAGLIVRRQGQGTFVAGDATAASKAHAKTEARAMLREAILRAKQLGLTSTEQRKVLDRVLGKTDD